MHVKSDTMRLAWATAAAIACSLPGAARAGDPKLECIGAADKGQQARDDGRYRAARESFATCGRSVCPKVVAASCTKWAREIDDAMPSLVLSAKDGSGADVSDVRVTFDGAPLASSLDGKPIDVDPGAHKLRFEHEGSAPVERDVVVKAGEKLREISVTFAAAEKATPVVVAPVATSGGGNTGRTVATVVLGVLAGGALAGGVAFGLASQGDASTAASLRGGMPSTACTGAGASSSACQSLSSAVDAESRDATLGVVMYVGAGVLAAAAVVAWLVWPKPSGEHPTTTVLLAPGFAGIGGTF